MCHERDVEIWSLTDHDNCYGCKEASEAARGYGITFIPGIEISAYHDASVHILGYGIDYEGEVIEDYARRRVHSRRERMHSMIERLGEMGVDVSIEQVDAIAGDAILGRPHLARALVANEAVDSIQVAFDKYLHTGGPAHVALGWPKVDEAIDLIHRAEGIAVVAHPGQYDLDIAIKDWVEAGLDGIEVTHPQHNRSDRKRYRKIADDHGLLKTASSDFHGNRGRGSHFGRVPFPTSWLDAFLAELDIS
jgi:predicted metal-dependent phosphoesterase TrpH